MKQFGPDSYRATFLALKANSVDGVAAIRLANVAKLIGFHHETVAKNVSLMIDCGALTILKVSASFIAPLIRLNVDDVETPMRAGMTYDQIDKLKLLWATTTLSTIEMATQIGVTKDAFIGKAHRLMDDGELAKRPPYVRPSKVPKVRPPRKSRADPNPIHLPHTAGNRGPSGRGVSALTLRGLTGLTNHLPELPPARQGSCRWPLRCGDNAELGNWCAHHAGLLGKRVTVREQREDLG